MTDATENIRAALAVLEVALTRTKAATSDYRVLLGAIRDLCNALEALEAAGRPF